MEAWPDAPRFCLLADRAYDGDALRAWLAQQGLKAVIPARSRRLEPQPYAPEAYKARRAAAQSLGWLQRGRRVATRYDPYAQRYLGFLYLAAPCDPAAIKTQRYLARAVCPSCVPYADGAMPCPI